MTKDEAMKLALEALEKGITVMRGLYGGWRCTNALKESDEAIEALRQALEQQEPVAQYSDIVSNGGLDPRNRHKTAPPKREWVGLTDDEYASAWAQSKGDVLDRLVPFARAIEAKLKEKNIAS
jgi:hypothetical protein